MIREIHRTKTTDGMHYLFPRRRAPSVRLPGVMHIAIGVMLALFVVAYFPEKLTTAHDRVAAVVLGTAAAILLAISAVPLAIGLWMVIGHDEIEAGAETLRACRCARWLRWSRARSTRELKQFTIACFRSPRYAAHSLYAEFQQGPPLLLAAWYPGHWLQAVAGDLAKRIAEDLRQGSDAPSTVIVERELDSLKIAAWNRPYATAAIYGGIFVFAGAIAFFSAFPQWARDRASRQWPSTDGRVITSEIAIAERKKRTNDFRPTKFYRPNIIYRYQVGDQELTGSRRFFGVGSEESEKPKAAEQVVADYPAGKSVRVFYDPRAPAESVLEPGGGALGDAALSFIGGALLVTGTPFVVVYYYRARSSRHHLLHQPELAYDPAQPGRVADYVIQGWTTRSALGLIFVGLLAASVMGALLAAFVLAGT